MTTSPGLSNPSSPAILVAEDDRAVRAVVVKRLQALGYNVLQAGDGNEALQAADDAQRNILITITDWDMPKINGVELAKALADNETGNGPPVVLLTARDFELADGMLEGTNVVAVMRKPFSGRKLVEKITEIIANANQARKAS